MRMKMFGINRLGIYSLLGLSALCSPILNAQSLEMAVAQALDTHPDIKQAFARFKSKEEDVNRASAGYLPTLDLTASIQILQVIVEVHLVSQMEKQS